MKRNLFLLLILCLVFSFVSVRGVSANYNLTCERDCVDVISETFENCTSHTLYDRTELYNITMFWTDVYEGNTSSRSFRSQSIGISTDGTIENCFLKSVLDLKTPMPSIFVCDNETFNATLQVLNLSNQVYDSYTCSNSSTFTNFECSNMGRNESRADTFNFEWVQYDSNDGTCSGNVVTSFTSGCDTNRSFSPGVDYNYRYERYQLLELDDCFNSSQNTGRPSDVELNCEIPCQESSYAFMVNWTITDLWDRSCNLFYSPSDNNFNWTFETCGEEDRVIDCASWSSPFNDSLLYGCDCSGDEVGEGLLCEDDSCNLTCVGTATEPQLSSNVTVQSIITNGTPQESLEFYGDQAKGFFAGLGPGLSIILWYSVLVIIILLFGGFVALMFRSI